MKGKEPLLLTRGYLERNSAVHANSRSRIRERVPKRRSKMGGERTAVPRRKRGDEICLGLLRWPKPEVRRQKTATLRTGKGEGL